MKIDQSKSRTSLELIGRVKTRKTAKAFEFVKKKFDRHKLVNHILNFTRSKHVE